MYNCYMLYNEFSTPKLSCLNYRHSVNESLLPDPITTTVKSTSNGHHPSPS